MKLCIGGYAGCGNVGDDAVLQSYLSEVRAGNEITALTGHPRVDSRRFGVRCVYRKDPVAVLWALRRSEVFVCGGGSLLQNETGELSLLYYLSLLRLARLCGCETRLMAAGIGPLHGEAWVERVMRELSHCASVTVRDGDSHRFLLSHGLDAARITRVADPAEALKPPPTERLAYLKHEQGMRERPYCCVVLRAVGGEARERLMAELKALLRRWPAVPVFPLFDPRSDGAFTRWVAERLGGIVVSLREPADGLAWIGGSAFTVSMRLHPLIFAKRCGVVGLGVSLRDEERKLASFCRESNMEHLFLSEL